MAVGYAKTTGVGVFVGVTVGSVSGRMPPQGGEKSSGVTDMESTSMPYCWTVIQPD